jgi:hypothetical protein
LAAQFLTLLISAAAGQTSILNLPSTDTAAKKSLSMEADFYAHFAPYKNNGVQEYGTTIIYGASKDIEVGVNLFASQRGGKPGIEMQPNIKWRFYGNQRYGIAASAGSLAFLPLNESAGDNATAVVYVNVSKSFRKGEGTRITGGVYTFAGRKQAIGDRSGIMLGIEHPVSEKMFILADWASGENRAGYISSGLSYELFKKHILTAGYSFGNSGRGNNYLTLAYAVTF